jgi:hypothetical protein
LLGAVPTLVHYWLKGRFTRASGLVILIGEVIGIFGVLFVGGTFLSFANRFNQGAGLSEVGLNLIMALFLVGLVQSGFNGSGLPIRSADVDYVFTSPVKPREVFIAKIAINSMTTVLLSFPPILALYLRFSFYYHTSFLSALLAGLVTLTFFATGLILSADISLSLGSVVTRNARLLRNAFIGSIIIVSLLPITLLIPAVPKEIGDIAEVLPSGLAAALSTNLVDGTAWNWLGALQLLSLFAWLGSFFLIGLHLSRRHFYEVLQVTDIGSQSDVAGAKVTSRLDTRGKSVSAVVRAKESVIMSRTKEKRSLLINALFLSGFMIIYSLSGVFQSSPTSFLLILFIIGSFGAGTASRWLEKERLWIIKTSDVDVTRYVQAVFRARVTPLLLVLTPVTILVGVPLIIGESGNPSSLISVLLALPGALEIAAITMGGGLYFASRYGQSTTDEILSTQAQDLADVKRFLFQTVINLVLVSPLFLMVLGAGLTVNLFKEPVGPSAVILILVSFGYTYAILRTLLDSAAKSIRTREDL